jgi:hypothetical protein
LESLAKGAVFRSEAELLVQSNRSIGRGEAGIYLGVAALSFLLFVAGFGPRRFLSDIPLTVGGDSLHHLTIAKSIIESHWYWHIARLSAPFSLPMVNFPVGGTFDYVIMLVLSAVIRTPGQLVMAFYALTFSLSTFAAMYCLRRMHLSLVVSGAVAVLYAFAPFVFYRNIDHLMLTTYLLPFVILLCIHVLTNSVALLSPAEKIVLLAASALLGLNYIYNSFFACFFILVSIVIAVIRYREIRPHILPIASMGLIMVTAGLSLLPTWLSLSADEVARRALFGVKALDETDVYGLKIRHLFRPSPESPIRFLRDISNNLIKPFPFENENVSARLGLVACAGFVGLFVAGFLNLLPGRDRSRAVPGPIGLYGGPLMILLVVALLLATVGGFGSLFNYFISPEIRAYNRISPFILFICLAFVGMLLDAATAGYRPFVRCVGVALVLIVGLADEVEFGRLKRTWHDAANELSDFAPFIESVERRLPSAANVYQLPYVAYPHNTFMRDMREHEHFRSYIFSKDLRWSWPAMSGEAIQLQERLRPLSGRPLVEALVAAGYQAVWVNRGAYEDRATALTQQLVDAGAEPVANNAAGKFVVLSLSKVTAELQAAGPQDLARRRTALFEPYSVSAGDTVEFSSFGTARLVVGEGWAQQEVPYRWTEGPRAVINLLLKNDAKENLDLVLRAGAFLPPGRPTLSVRVIVAGEDKGTFRYTAGMPYPEIRAPLFGPEGNLSGPVKIELLVDDPRSPYEMHINDDRRALGLQVFALTIRRRN